MRCENMRFATVALSLALLANAGVSLAQTRVDTRAMEAYIQPYVASSNFAGAVLVQRDGRTQFEKSCGLSDHEKAVPTSSPTKFHVASLSMQFTAAAILRLVDQHRMHLETRVNEIVPGITGGEKISIRDLLIERSGLADINELPDYGDVLKEHQTPTSLVNKVKGRPLLFEPGSKFQHEEHSAYNLLALIVEKKTGMPFAKAMKKLVFEPAGLKHTIVDDDTIQEDGVAKGFQPKGVSQLEPAATIHWSAKTGNGSVVTTARDQVRWVRVLFAGHFLSEASRGLILGTSPPVGYGWFRRESPRFHETAYYMNGRAPGFSSFVLYLAKEQLTVVVLSNIYSSATTTIGNDLAAIALNLPHTAFQPSRETIPPEELRSISGKFTFGADFYQPNAEVALVPEGSDLSLHWPSGDVSPLIPLTRDHFIDRAYWEEVIVERDANGRMISLAYDRFHGKLTGPD
jgi:D-alanyl-D-alanine carboxypeptidase